MSESEENDTLESNVRKLTGPEGADHSNQERSQIINEFKKQLSNGMSPVLNRMKEIQDKSLERIQELSESVTVENQLRKISTLDMCHIPEGHISIVGRVHGEQTDQPLVGATVRLKGEYVEENDEQLTDAEGRFASVLPVEQHNTDPEPEVVWNDRTYKSDDISFTVEKKTEQKHKMNIRVSVDDPEEVTEVDEIELKVAEKEVLKNLTNLDELQEQLSDRNNLIDLPISSIEQVLETDSDDET